MSQFSAYRPPVPLTILSFFPLRHFHFVNSLRNSLRHSTNQCLDIYWLGSLIGYYCFLEIFIRSYLRVPILCISSPCSIDNIVLPSFRHFHFVNSLRSSLRHSPNQCLDIYWLGSLFDYYCFLEIFIRSYLHVPILCISATCSIHNIVLLSLAPFPFRKLVEKFH